MNFGEVGKDTVLGSVYEIEDLLEEILVLQDKVKHYESLKKYRAQVLDQKIDDVENSIKIYRQVILQTMKERAPDDNTLDFAPLGRVTRRKSNDLWCVDDEKKMMNFLDKKELRDEVIELKEKVVKKKLDEVLKSLNNKGVEVPGTHLQRGEEGVSIVFEKEAKPKNTEDETTGTVEINDEMETLEI